MKKVLYLSLIVFPIFSMQLDLVSSKSKVNRFQEKLSKQISNIDKVHIKPASVFVPNRLGSLDLYHSKKGFYVRQNDKKQTIKKHFTDPILRDITKPQLKAFLANGYLTINQMEDGEYSLKAKGRMVGGGPILGTIAYWVTKSICYGTAVGAIGATVIGTGGAIGGAVGGGAFLAGTAVTGTAVATTATTAIATTAGIVTGTVATGASIATGAGLVGATITGAGLAGTAATTTAAVVTSAGGIGATIAGVEALSVAVGTFFGMLPTP